MKPLMLSAAGLALTLGGCGSSTALQPSPGQVLPVAPYGATAKPTPAQLLTASNQARPQRADDLLSGSEERRSDDYDLPPN